METPAEAMTQLLHRACLKLRMELGFSFAWLCSRPIVLRLDTLTKPAEQLSAKQGARPL